MEAVAIASSPIQMRTPSWAFRSNVQTDYISDKKSRTDFWTSLAPINSIHNEYSLDINLVKKLGSEFFEEFEKKKSNYAQVDSSELTYYFAHGANALLKRNPSAVSIELTSSKSIFLFSTIKNKNVYLEFFFSEENGQFAEATLNVYENKTQQLTTHGSFEDTLQEMDKFFNTTNGDYLRYLRGRESVVSGYTIASVAV